MKGQIRRRIATARGNTLEGIEIAVNDMCVGLETASDRVVTIDRINVHLRQGHEIRYEAIISFHWEGEARI